MPFSPADPFWFQTTHTIKADPFIVDPLLGVTGPLDTMGPSWGTTVTATYPATNAKAAYGQYSFPFAAGGSPYVRFIPTASNDIRFFGSDFTVEMMFYPTAFSGVLFELWAALVMGSVDASGVPTAGYSTDSGATYPNTVTGNALTLNAWNHIAYEKFGNIYTLYVQGVGGTPLVSPGGPGAMGSPAYQCTFGADRSNANRVTGYIDEMRVTRAARYRGNFTPSEIWVPPSVFLSSPPELADFAIAQKSGFAPPNGGMDKIGTTEKESVTSVIQYYPGVPLDVANLGKIVGTVKEKGTPNVPVRRRVRAYRDIDGFLFGETASDPVTGAYKIDRLPMGERFTVISHDYNHNYNAVNSDNLLPEPML